MPLTSYSNDSPATDRPAWCRRRKPEDFARNEDGTWVRTDRSLCHDSPCDTTDPLKKLIRELEEAASAEDAGRLIQLTEGVIGCSIECWNLNLDERDRRNNKIKEAHCQKLALAERRVTDLARDRGEQASMMDGGGVEPMDLDGEPVAASELQAAQDAVLRLKATKLP